MAEPPAAIVAGVAVKLAITGNGLTVTVTLCVAEWPAPSLTVRAYVVVATGETLTVPPLAIAPTPLSMVPEPPLYVAESVAEPPALMVEGVALKAWIAGSGLTVTVTL